MPMKNPPHPGLILKDCLDELGRSEAEAAQGLGITQQQLHSLLAGRFDIALEVAERLEKTIGSTAGTWLRLQEQYDHAQATLGTLAKE